MEISDKALEENNAAPFRLFCMLMVLVSQLCFILWGEGAEPLEPATGLTLWKHAFIPLFGLSGFFILSSWERRADAVSFSVARVLRIFPGLWCAILVMLFAGAFLSSLPLSVYAAPGAIAEFILRAGLLMDGKAVLPGVFGYPAPNALVLMPLWTLKYLFLCYGAVLMLGLMKATGRTWPYLLGGAALIGLVFFEMFWPEGINPDSPLAHAIRFCGSFFLGMLAWRYRKAALFNPYLIGASAFLLLIALIWGGLSPVFYCILEVYLALALVFALPSAKIMQKLPDLTLGLCLYGWPVTQALRVVFPQAGFTTLLGPMLVITCALALVSALCVERPAVRYVPRLTAQLKGLGPRLKP